MPTKFKIGWNQTKMSVVPDSCISEVPTMLLNVYSHMKVVNVFKPIQKAFDILYKKRAFVHHLVALGIDEAEINEARENLTDIIDENLQGFCCLYYGVEEEEEEDESDY